MEKVNFTTTKGIMEEIQSIINDVKCDSEDLKKSNLRLTGCKHAIQIVATTLEYNKFKDLKTEKLKAVELE